MTTIDQTTPSQSETQTIPPNTPVKFIDPKTHTLRVDALVNSYLALEKKLSTPRGPGADAVPASPDDYKIGIPHQMFTVDPDVNRTLFSLGCTNGQAQGVYDLAAQKLMPVVAKAAQDYKSQRDLDRLQSTFGGPEAWDEMSRQLLAYGQKNLPPQALNGMASTYEGVMALHAMMKGGHAALPASGAAPATDASPDNGDLRAMMRDPRYWKKKDPAYVAQVTDGFKRAYQQ